MQRCLLAALYERLFRQRAPEELGDRVGDLVPRSAEPRVLGEPGHGKSALIKSLLWRMAGLYPDRWVAILDPKGEYATLAEAAGAEPISLRPGGPTILNPLDTGPAAVLHRCTVAGSPGPAS
jgi:hypothetical protein